MQTIGEVPHPDIKITLFYWNNKYLIKLELGLLEQTFKVSELDVSGEEDIKGMLDENFLEAALKRFKDMQQSLFLSLGNI